MNQTLEQIRDHTRDGAIAMSAAAGEIREAAQGFKADVSAASAEGASAVRGQMAAAGSDASKAISGVGSSSSTRSVERRRRLSRLRKRSLGRLQHSFSRLWTRLRRVRVEWFRTCLPAVSISHDYGIDPEQCSRGRARLKRHQGGIAGLHRGCGSPAHDGRHDG